DGGALSAEQRWERAARLADYLEQTRPAMFAEPRLRFTVGAAQRSRGFGKEAERYTLVLSKQAVAEPWRVAALAERWLSEPERLPPQKATASCRYINEKPLLDGEFDEPMWQSAELLPLRGAGALPAGGGEHAHGAWVRVA